MPINATFHGFVETTTDSLLLFEACHRGILPKISRRLQERERGSVKSGTVFIFDEKESGIKRWTDGLIWSPSRILGNFLIYRELGGRESLNEKSPNHDDQYLHHQYSNNTPYLPQTNNLLYDESTHESVVDDYDDMTIEERNRERNLVGSLTDTYKFRKGGLIKKTLSIQLNGCTQHLISYYTKEDVLKCRLSTPSSISELSSLQISPELLLKQSFRVPPSVEFADMMLKRPSLSPSSTTSSSTSHSTTTASHNIKRLSTHNITSHPYPASFIKSDQDEDDDHSLYHSRRLAFEAPSCARKSARTSFDSTSGHSRRSSCLTYPLDSPSQSNYGMSPITNEMNEVCIPRYYEGREINNSTQSSFRSSSIDRNTAVTTGYETGGPYQNINNTPQPSAATASAFVPVVDYEPCKRRNARGYTPPSTMSSSASPPLRDNRQNSISSPPALGYQQQRLHNIPTISVLSSSSYNNQQQSQTSLSPPLLSPSSFLWSNNEDTNKYTPPLRLTTPPSILTSSYNSNTDYKQETVIPIALREPPSVGNESSRYLNNNNNQTTNRLATRTPSSFHHGTQQLYYQQQPSNVRFNNNNYNENHIMASPIHTDITTSPPEQATGNKNTSFY